LKGLERISVSNDRTSSWNAFGYEQQKVFVGFWPTLIRCGLTAALAFIAGCSSIPKAELNRYADAFRQAKSASEDIILSGQTAVEEETSDARSKLPIPERVARLKKTTESFEARLLALQIVQDYNSILLRLAAGESPGQLKADLETLQTSLKAFNISGLSRIVANAGPYGQMIATAISLIDDALRNRAFRNAVNEGEAPVLGILQILRDDADSIHTIIKGRRMARQTAALADIAPMHQTIMSTLEATDWSAATAKQQADGIVKEYDFIAKSLNAAPLKWTLPAPAVAAAPPAGAPAAQPATVAALTGLIEQVRNRIKEINVISEEIEAHRRVIAQYKELLDETGKALQALRVATRGTRSAATRDFIKAVLSLRKAYLELHERSAQ
jgi:hypothetical protein